MPDPLDLLTADQLTTYLTASGAAPNAAQAAALPALLTAASREVQRVLGRVIPLAAYDELLEPTPGRPGRGEPATCLTSQYPISASAPVVALAGRTAALTVVNSDPATNQMAWAQLACAGDPEVKVTFTGLTLTRVASAVTTTTTLTFAANPTVQALAAAVAGAGGGWGATVVGPHGPYPSADLLGAREAKPGFAPGCALDLFPAVLPDYSLDRATGLLSVGPGGGGGGAWAPGSGAWASWAGAGAGHGGTYGPRQVRLRYTAGYDLTGGAVAPLQEAVTQIVQLMFARLATDPALASESAKDYSYVAREVLTGLPRGAWETLQAWKDWRF